MIIEEMTNYDRPKQNTICLNMIVKNEGRIIKRLLESVIDIIDCYCICDTGSTDDTKYIIQEYFKDKNIQGKIMDEPFRDFGYNRTIAMKSAVGMSSHLLLLDADMIIEISPLILDSKENIDKFKNSLVCDAYNILQGNDAFQYKNVRILRNKPEYSYFGVTHECVMTSPGSTYSDITKEYIFIKDIGDGGCKTDKNARDIKLLEKGLEELPNNDRYTFYLANSYYDNGGFEKAIELYKKRIEIGGWVEEVWFSYYSIGNCYEKKNDMINAIHYWMESYQHYPKRLESIYKIISYYRGNQKYRIAYMFFSMCEFPSLIEEVNFLFTEKDVYDYKIDYEFSVMCYYCNIHNKDVYKSIMKVLNASTTPEYIVGNVLSNYKFYSPKLIDMETPVPYPNGNSMENYSVILPRIGNISVIDRDVFVSSTPSLCLFNNKTSGEKELIVNVRYVNYRINEKGEYINSDKIVSKNIIAIMEYQVDVQTKSINCRKKKEFELDYDTTMDNVYVGLEDVRILGTSKDVVYNANRGLDYGNSIAVEHGYILPMNGRTNSSAIMRCASQKQVEKNWVLFMDPDQKVKIVYNWFPLTIGHTLENNGLEVKFEVTECYDTPPFMKLLRGSTNGIHVGNDEIWFICHIVSYEDRRNYYHVLVVLDKKTFELKRYSRPFTFEGNAVEYTLGMVFFEEISQFMIGYSVMDNTTNYMMVSKGSLDGLF